MFLSDELNPAECISVPSNPKSVASEARTDFLLVERFNNGEEGAFVEIVRRHQKKLFMVAFGFLRSPSDAEEITQDAFVRAHRCLKDFRGDASLATWLYRITANLSRNRYWHRKRRGAGLMMSLDCELSEGGESLGSLFADKADAPPQSAAFSELESLIETCRKQLDPLECEILVLAADQKLSYIEIAEKLFIPIGTVKSRLARARKSLAALLPQACPDFGRTALPRAWLEKPMSLGHTGAFRVS